MFRLPNGNTIRPRQVEINGVIYPKNIFTQWSVEKLNSIGIYPVIYQTYDQTRYRILSESQTTISGIINVTYELEEREDYLDNEWSKIRDSRNMLLKETDFLMTVDYYNKLSTEEKTEIETYRETLRNIPQDQTDPLSITWPSKPEFIE